MRINYNVLNCRFKYAIHTSFSLQMGSIFNPPQALVLGATFRHFVLSIPAKNHANFLIFTSCRFDNGVVQLLMLSCS
jgi:hypothetical protein